MDYGLEQAYPDGELDEQGAQATDGVDAVCFVHFHCGARELLSVVFVFFLQFFELGLERGHLHHLSALADGQRYENDSDNQREEDDGDAEIEEGYAVEQHEAVYHRLDDNQVP